MAKNTNGRLRSKAEIRFSQKNLFLKAAKRVKISSRSANNTPKIKPM